MNVSNAPSPLLGAALAHIDASAKSTPLDDLQRRARSALESRGLPGPKDEAWRFTRVRAITDIAFRPPSSPGLTSDERARVASVIPSGVFAAISVDGHLLERTGVPPRGVELVSLGERTPPPWIHERLGHIAGDPQGFAALNAAQFGGGVALRLDGTVDAPIYLVHLTRAARDPHACHPRLLAVAGANSRATLVELWLCDVGEPSLTNAVTELHLDSGAVVEHVRVAEGAPKAPSVGLVAVEQDADSSYRSRVVTLGGAPSRLDLRVRLAGKGAECILDGLYLAAAGEQVDHHTFVEHVGAHTTSLEKYKGILDGDGSAIFDGIIHVRRDAKGANAHQENRNVLLSDEAVVDTKPHLEIDADDVRCTHGATVGRLDEDQRFYLRARGIDDEAARAILTHAFAVEMLDRIPVEAERGRLGTAVLERMGRAELAEELQ